eukprot:XP_016660365.1 PREDICTED: uncharacterized protein LOC107883911 [Acyrthosiphon pisum]
MDKLRVEEVAINLELMKRSRFYHIFNPNGTKIFNCNAYRLLLFLYGSIVNCIVVFSTLGFFVEMDDTMSFTDLFVAIFVLINFFLCYWRICVFMYNVNAIYDVLSVSRFDLLKSKHCCKNVNVLNDYRDRTIKITNYFFLFSSTVMSQWIIYPLVVIAFTMPEDEYGRFQNIMNLRYPVSTYTYNQYYFIFYLMEVMVAIFTMYAMIFPDILLMSVCWAIIAQQEVLTQAFKNIGHEDNSQMEEICENINIKPEARLKASGLMEGLFSDHQMVFQTHNDLKKNDRDFTSIKQAADNFLTWASSKLETVENTSIQIHDIILSIVVRFEKHKHLYADFNCLDPNNFCIDEPLPDDLLKSIHLNIVPFMPDCIMDSMSE